MNSSPISHQTELPMYIFFAVVIFFLQVVVGVVMTGVGAASDYPYHLSAALNNDLVALIKKLPYPLWHLSARFVNFLGIHGGYAVGIVNGLYTLLSMFFLNKILLYFLKDIDKNVVTILTVILTFVSAIYIPWFNSMVYIGQGSINIYHNPTFIAVKPFALLAFYLLVKMFDKYESVSRLDYVTLSVVLFLSVLAKPCFVQVFFFGAALTLLLIVIQKKAFRFAKGVMFAFFPSLLWMTMQFLTVFHIDGLNGGGGHGVYIKLITVSPHTPNMFFSALLFLAFPVYVTFTNIKALKNNYSFILSWICVLVGFLQMLFLHEAGRESDGNFSWGYMNAACLLYAISLVVFIKKYYTCHAENVTIKIGFSLLFGHFVSGIYYLCYVIRYATFA